MIKKAILPLLLLATGAALVVQVGAKDQFDDKSSATCSWSAPKTIAA